MTYGSTLIGLPEAYGLSYGATCLFAAVVILVTLGLARLYLPWKRANKNTLIAKYV